MELGGANMKKDSALLPVASFHGGSKEPRPVRTAHNMSSSSLRKKSDLTLVSRVKWGLLRDALVNIQEVFLGTKLFPLFLAVPFAVAARYLHLGSVSNSGTGSALQAWLFALSMLGLIPLAERLSFLTEQIAYYTGPTVGGLLNATCGNATELIVALFALGAGKMGVVKCSLLGSILSNLLLVLGSSLLLGGLANLPTAREQVYNRKQADVNVGLLLLGVLCHALPLMLRWGGNVEGKAATLGLSRACAVVMLLVYSVHVFFQLGTHRQMFEADGPDDDDDDVRSPEESPVIGFASGITWLLGMTALVSVLSEYVVATIEEASESWGLSVSFVSVILLPIVGNAAEHAGAIIFAYKNKLDITLGVSLGSSAQISLFVVPLSVLVAWMMGVPMDLDFNLLPTGALLLSVLLTAFTLQDGTSHYLKGLVLLLSYVAIGVCFFHLGTPRPLDARVIQSTTDVYT